MQRTPPELTSAARRLRVEMTEAERRLWQHLRILRPRFTRQLVIDRYIADFACRSQKLIVELDGGQHAIDAEADVVRTAYLEANGWQVMRFWNTEVFESFEGVVDRIIAASDARPSTHPQPLPLREGSDHRASRRASTMGV